MRTRAKKIYIPNIKVPVPGKDGTFQTVYKGTISSLLMTVIRRERTTQTGRWPPEPPPTPVQLPEEGPKRGKSAPAVSLYHPAPLLSPGARPENPIKSAGGTLEVDPIANHRQASVDHHGCALAAFESEQNWWEEFDKRPNVYELPNYPRDYVPTREGLDPHGILSRKPRKKGDRVGKKDQWTLWKRRVVSKDMMKAGKKDMCRYCFVKGRTCPQCKRIKGAELAS